MTTIAALARDGAVWMAADTGVSVCDRPIVGAVEKIRRIKAGTRHEMLVGIAGAGALGGILDLDVQPDDLPADTDPDRVVLDVVRRLSRAAVDAGVVEDGQMDGMLLIGYAGRLWTGIHMWAGAHPDGVAVVGSGGDAAIGAIDAMLRHTHLPPARVVAEAVGVAIGRDLHSTGPIQFELLPAATEGQEAP